MPNHVHLLVGVSQNSALSRFIKRLNLKYFAHYRRKHTYSGHLWQDRFKSKIIEEESYFIQCGKYIESNPVKAFLVKKPEDYHFSSYRYYGFGTKDNLLDEDPLYAGLNACVERRQLIYRNMIINDLVEKSLICK
jgi:putative transposase